MVGRLVQEHNVGFAQKGPGEEDAAAGSPGKRFEMDLGVNLQAGQNLLGFQRVPMIIQCVGIRADDVKNPPGQVEWDLLGEPADAGSGGLDDFPQVRLGLPGENAEHGAFAGPIGTQQADAISSLNMELHIIQQGKTAITHTDIF